jgi:hypothetical protein
MTFIVIFFNIPIEISTTALKSRAEIHNQKDNRPPILVMYRMKEYLGIALNE